MSTREIARGGLLAAAATAWLYFGGVMPQIGPAACLIAGAASAIPLLRRANAAPQQKQPETLLLTAGGITLDPEQRVAVKNGEIVELTAKEYDLIELLVKNPRRVYSRENLMDLVWGYTYAGDYRTVDVHIRRLREKLEENPAAPQHILTKWGVGYYLKD